MNAARGLLLALAGAGHLLSACAHRPADELDLLIQRFPLGATEAELSASIAAHCERAVVHRYSPEQAAPYREQTQIDCFGYPFAGAPRKIELLINEGALGFYWLLIEPDEREHARRMLVERFGPPACENAQDTIFAAQSVALRAEPAEILVSQRTDFEAITGGCL